MTQPIQINDEQDTTETLLFEYEAIKAIAAGMAEQYKAIQEQNAMTHEAVKALGDRLIEAVTAFTEAVGKMSITVNNTIPEQAPPVINYQAPEQNPVIEFKPEIKLPEQAAPVVNFTPPAETKKKIRYTARRNNKTGLIESIEEQ